MVTKAAVLCGGEGTRLRPLSNYFQKTMIPIGPKRRPLLEYIVRLIGYNGISDDDAAHGLPLGGHRALLRRRQELRGEHHLLQGSRGEEGYRALARRSPRRGDAATGSTTSSCTTGTCSRRWTSWGSSRSTRGGGLPSPWCSPRTTRSLSGSPRSRTSRVVSFSEKPTLPLNVTVGALMFSKECVPSSARRRPGRTRRTS